MKTIILASTSPRRKVLLEKLGLDFIIEPSNYEEVMDPQINPFDLAKKLSFGKANEVALKHTNSIVIGADTFISFENKVLGKPGTTQKAFEMLKMLNGKPHSVITGYTIIDTDTKVIFSDAVETKVYFRNLTDAEINKYIEIDNVLDKAGAYAIQEKGFLLVDKVEGDFENIIGLPISKLALSLRQFNVNVL
jgi:septum formation protein